jgi:hypothetical protein
MSLGFVLIDGNVLVQMEVDGARWVGIGPGPADGDVVGSRAYIAGRANAQDVTLRSLVSLDTEVIEGEAARLDGTDSIQNEFVQQDATKTTVKFSLPLDMLQVICLFLFFETTLIMFASALGITLILFASIPRRPTLLVLPMETQTCLMTIWPTQELC